MKIQGLTSGASMGDRLCLIGGIVEAVTLVVYSIYGAVYSYFDVVVFVCLLASMLLCAAAVLLEKKAPIAGACKLLAVFAGAFAFALFFYNSFPVWADKINNITMYNSRGGLAPVIALCVLFVAALLGLTVSCFMKDGGAETI